MCSLSAKFLLTVAALGTLSHASQNKSGSALEETDCTVYLTEKEGELVWTEGSNSADCSWIISLNTSFGLELKVEQVYLGSDATPDYAEQNNATRRKLIRNSVILTSYEGPYPDPEKTLRVFKGNHPSVTKPGDFASGAEVTLPVSVDLVRHHQVLLQLTGLSTRADVHRPKETSRGHLYFKVVYNAVPVETMPPKVGQGRYNCSPPYEVPGFLKCDVAVQCAGGEDELQEDCFYTGHCGPGRIALNSRCVQFHFPGELISPQKALQRCGLRKATSGLEMLQEPVLFQFITRVVSLSGYDSLVLAIRRVRTQTEGLAHLYRFLWQWKIGDKRVLHGLRLLQGEDPTRNCGILRVSPYPHFQAVSCARESMYGYQCTHGFVGIAAKETDVSIRQADRLSSKFPVQKCADGTYTHPFLSCAETASEPTETSRLPRFECDNGLTIHYSLERDGVNDCGDGSDTENSGSVASELTFECTRQQQPVPMHKVCNGSPDCFDGSDEEDCPSCSAGTFYCDGLGCLPDAHRAMNVCPSQGVRSDNSSAMYTQTEQDLQATFVDWSLESKTVMVLDLDGFGMAVLKSLDTGTPCDETHVHCNTGFCVPVYLVNNGQVDCPYPYSEERSGERTQCPGYYRCYRHPDICLHDDHLCDGIYQCPLKDDERYCGLISPPGCTREGLALTCNQTFLVSSWANYSWLRYLDLSGRPVSPRWLAGFDENLPFSKLLLLISFLNISSCGLEAIISLYDGLVVLDLSYNKLTKLNRASFHPLRGLRHLNLSHNLLFQTGQRNVHAFLQIHIRITRLKSMSITSTGFDLIEPGTFSSMKQLQHLDIRNNPVKNLSLEMFRGLTGLHTMYTDDPRLCCIYFSLYPDARMGCIAPQDELSSCEDLLRSDFFRGCLWTLSVMALVGNTGVLVYRLFLETRGTSTGFRALVANLCASDFLMGAYLMMIGCADGAYRGQYLWKQEWWVESTACQAAGFLSLLSSEVSALIICLITLDRLLVLRFPLTPHLHLQARGTGAASCLCWLLGVTLASVPLLADWRLYSHNGICLPLPITRRLFSGHQYAFAIYIVFNLVLFILVGAGQLLIYQSVRSTSPVATSTRSQQDTAIARRLFLIVFSDFCCWFPIGLMGVLATRGTPIPSEVNVWTAVFVLPLNSALNPFLYTLNTVLERRRQRKFSQRVELMLRRLDREMTSWSHEQLQDLLRHVQRVLLRHSKTNDDEDDITGE